MALVFELLALGTMAAMDSLMPACPLCPVSPIPARLLGVVEPEELTEANLTKLYFDEANGGIMRPFLHGRIPSDWPAIVEQRNHNQQSGLCQRIHLHWHSSQAGKDDILARDLLQQELSRWLNRPVDLLEETVQTDESALSQSGLIEGPQTTSTARRIQQTCIIGAGPDQGMSMDTVDRWAEGAAIMLAGHFPWRIATMRKKRKFSPWRAGMTLGGSYSWVTQKTYIQIPVAPFYNEESHNPHGLSSLDLGFFLYTRKHQWELRGSIPRTHAELSAQWIGYMGMHFGLGLRFGYSQWVRTQDDVQLALASLTGPSFLVSLRLRPLTRIIAGINLGTSQLDWNFEGYNKQIDVGTSGNRLFMEMDLAYSHNSFVRFGTRSGFVESPALNDIRYQGLPYKYNRSTRLESTEVGLAWGINL